MGLVKNVYVLSLVASRLPTPSPVYRNPLPYIRQDLKQHTFGEMHEAMTDPLHETMMRLRMVHCLLTAPSKATYTQALQNGRSSDPCTVFLTSYPRRIPRRFIPFLHPTHKFCNSTISMSRTQPPPSAECSTITTKLLVSDHPAPGTIS